MAQTKIKAGLFEGVIGNGTDGYFLMSNGDGTMTWSSILINPTIASIAYPGSATAADPAGGETITVTGTGFKTGATVTIGGTAAPAVSYVSETQITFTTPAKAAGDYDIVVTNTDTGSATFINGISYNGIPTWTTAAGSLGTFASDTTISTITLQATEPDAGTITFSITNGALPTGLSLTGANIDGTTTLETADTLYTFTVTATDNESQATPRTFTITVTKQFISTENFTINTYTGNGSTQSVEGKIGTAADFNGSSSYISVPNSAGNNMSTFSVSLWFKISNASALGTLISNGLAADNGYYLAVNVGGPIVFLTSDGNSNTATSTSPSTYADGNWHNVVLAYTAVGVGTSTYNIYVDGNSTPVITGSNGKFTGTSAQPLTIGKLANSSNYYLNGSIDQVRIFNKALSSSEVTTLYGENNTSSTKSTTDIFNDGSGVALYEFEEGAKDTGGVNGYIGGGGVFNGSSSRISLPSTINTNYVTPTGSFSAATWVNFNTVGTAEQQIICFNTTANLELGLNSNSNIGKIVMRIYNSGASPQDVYLISTTTISANTWYHVAITYNNGSWALYINGSSEDTGTQTLTQPTTNIFLGERLNNSQFLSGKIDQVRFFNTELDSTKVAQLAAETSASATKSTTDIFDDGSAVALYELEGNANDSGKFGNGAIDEGQSAVFDGTNSKITTSYNALFNDFSISLWVKINDLSIHQVLLGTTDSFATQSGMGMFYNPSENTIGFDGHINGTRITNQTGSYQITQNKWHHVVFTNNSSNNEKKLYINNNLQVNNTSLGYIDGQNYDLVFGSYNAYTNNRLNGSIDQVRIYSSVLSASDVEALASETNVPTANLVAHYKLDGNANDSAGSYNGTATSITYSDPAEFPKYNGTATNVLYAYDGTPTNVSFVGTLFEPDLVWIKNRDNAYSHQLYDSVRGAGSSKNLQSDNASQEGTDANLYGYLSSFDTNGYTVQSGTYSGFNNIWTNQSGQDYVAWMWKAANTTTTIAANTVGNTIASDVRANQAAGFSIVKYTGNGSAGATVGHGLSSVPEMVIVKGLDNALNWIVYHTGVGSTKYIQLNTEGAEELQSNYNMFNSTAPSSAVFSLGNLANTNSNALEYIAYCFHSVDGYQKIGSYVGNSSTAGPLIDVGFRPRFIMVKGITSGYNSHWMIIDSIRDTDTTKDKRLLANLTNIETDDPNWATEFNDNGFQPKSTFTGYNHSSGTYIYLAIA